ncbi:MAG: hypothetical protein QNJ37_04800 [Crocosphaera sp.]|nr:hypothetical protein [Crocosphaera sp.]
MVIKGLTDKKYNGSSIHSAILHKGGRKPESEYGYGSDLNNFLRLELLDPSLKYVLIDMGIVKIETGKPLTVADNLKPIQPRANKYDYLVEKLDIFLADEDIDKTFDTAMTLWDGTGLIQKCDRETIYLQREEYRDDYDCPRTRMVKKSLKCPMANKDVSIPCRAGCIPQGTLNFYIPQFLDYGCMKPCRLTVSAYSDFQSILQSLEAIKEAFGCIRYAPDQYPCPRGLIPLVLKRIKVPIKRPILEYSKENGKNVYSKIQLGNRKILKPTGKKAADSTWAVTLEINPIWLQGYQAWTQSKQLRAQGYTPTNEVIAQIPGVNADHPIIEVNAVTVPQAALPQTGLSQADLMTMQQIWQLNQQHPSWRSLPEFLDNVMQIYSVQTIDQLPSTHLNKILDHLKNRSLGEPDQF